MGGVVISDADGTKPALSPDQMVMLEALRVVAQLVAQGRVTMIAIAADTPSGAVLGWHMVPGAADPIRMRGLLRELDDKAHQQQEQGPTPTLFDPAGKAVQ